MAHIAILTHAEDNFEGEAYFLRGIVPVWREHGHTVTCLRGCEQDSNADIGILHVDLTVVPQEYMDYMKRFPVALNAEAGDISKRRVSRNILRQGEEYSGRVIVKTDCNHGGAMEARRRRPGYFARRFHSVLHRTSWRWRDYLSSWAYPIFDSMAEVPQVVWDNPHLVVEKFVAERDGEAYCLRVWSFLGDRWTNNRLWSNTPVIKSNVIFRRESAGEVPEELYEMRRELGFDHGKFDYGIVDGRVVLYDANRTPTLGSLQQTGYQDRMVLLAQGIKPYLDRLSA